MNWRKLLIRSLLIFLVVYYFLAVVTRLPNVQIQFHGWLKPRVEQFLKKQYSDIYVQLSKLNVQEPDLLIVNYENQSKIDQYLKTMKNSGRQSQRIETKKVAINIHYLFVFPFILLIAFTACIPLKLSNKIIAFVVTSLFLFFYIRLNVSLKLYFMLQVDPVNVYQLEGNLKESLTFLVPRITPGVTITFLLLVWLISLWGAPFIFKVINRMTKPFVSNRPPAPKGKKKKKRKKKRK